MARRWPSRLAVLAVIALLPMRAAVAADGPQCALPAVTPTPKSYGASEREPRRALRSTVYTLAVSWAPQFCATGEGMGGTFDRTFECDTKANRFGFVLHGLWPDGDGKTWPQYCRPAKLLRPATIRANLCLTPSADLLQHEWAKHGTCMSSNPAAYFRAAEILFRAVRFPDMKALSGHVRTAGDMRRAFAKVNRGIDERMIAVATDRGDWLTEVRLCLGPRMRPQACKPFQRGLADARAVRVRPMD